MQDKLRPAAANLIQALTTDSDHLMTILQIIKRPGIPAHNHLLLLIG